MFNWKRSQTVDGPVVLDEAYLERLARHLGEENLRELLADGMVELCDRIDRIEDSLNSGDADALARLRDEFGLAQTDLCRVTGKSKSEISKLLALHDRVSPEIQQAARSDKDTILTKRHLYNISKLNPEEQTRVAAQVQKDKLNAQQTEQLIKSNSPGTNGIARRQRRFKTTNADILITFRRKPVTAEHIRDVLAELQRQLEKSEI